MHLFSPYATGARTGTILMLLWYNFYNKLALFTCSGLKTGLPNASTLCGVWSSHNICTIQFDLLSIAAVCNINQEFHRGADTTVSRSFQKHLCIMQEKIFFSPVNFVLPGALDDRWSRSGALDDRWSRSAPAVSTQKQEAPLKNLGTDFTVICNPTIGYKNFNFSSVFIVCFGKFRRQPY
jgi:hypothetical protein